MRTRLRTMCLLVAASRWLGGGGCWFVSGRGLARGRGPGLVSRTATPPTSSWSSCTSLSSCSTCRRSACSTSFWRSAPRRMPSTTLSARRTCPCSSSTGSPRSCTSSCSCCPCTICRPWTCTCRSSTCSRARPTRAHTSLRVHLLSSSWGRSCRRCLPSPWSVASRRRRNARARPRRYYFFARHFNRPSSLQFEEAFGSTWLRYALLSQ